jgi:cytochrome P450
MREHIERTIDRQLEGLRPGESFDVIDRLAVPLPISLFAFMFGIGESEHAVLKKASDDFTRFVSNVRPSWPDAERSDRSLGELRALLLELVHQRRRAPRSDLASTIVAADDDGDMLSDDELLSLCSHLLIAGHETTTNLIANGLLAVLTHDESRFSLRDDPGLWPRAVEEMLRWETPLQRVKRRAIEPVELAGVRIDEGARIMVLVGAANRDPTAYVDAERFDIAASRRPHLAFGAGIHFCIGAALARLEGHVALERLLTAYPDLRLEPGFEPTWNPSLLRGLTALLVRC